MTQDIVKDVVSVYEKHADNNDRFQNLNVAGAMLGACFAVLSSNANKNDCVELVRRAQEKLGWLQ